MSQLIVLRISAAFLVISVAACGKSATLPDGKGCTHATLVNAQCYLDPTVNIASAKGWPLRRKACCRRRSFGQRVCDGT